MASPVASFYSVAAGSQVKGGILWSWLVAASTVNAVATIPGTTLGGSAGAPGSVAGDTTSSAARRVNAFSGMAFDHTRKRIALLANGGHSDYQGNEVSMIDLNQESPAWSLLKGIGTGYVAQAGYYTDNTPNARHTYWHNHWVPQHGVAGQWAMSWCSYAAGGVTSYANWDEFNPVNNTWDVGVGAGGTWANSLNPLTCFDETSGMGWGTSIGGTTLYRYDAGANTWGSKAFGGANYMYPALAYSASRSELFYCANGDNYSGAINGTLNAARLTNPTGTLSAVTRQAISINAGAALTHFLANTQWTPGIVWDEGVGCYWIYSGIQGSTMKFYQVVPNATTTWTMNLVTMTGTTIALSTGASAGGINSKLRYVHEWKGLILMTDANSPVYYIRTRA